MKNKLISKIKSREAIVGIIGLGYVGLPQLIRFSEEGFKTIGFDIDKDKIDKLNNGKSYIKHISLEKISTAVKNGFTATTDLSQISIVDAILICVPTPLLVHNQPDLSYIINSLESIKPHLKENQLIVLESTSYPGTTEEEVAPVIKDNGFEIGKNFFLGFSPEREDPGNKNYSTKTIPKVVSGYTENCLEITKALFDTIIDKTVPVSSTRVAEMTKILENVYRAVNIGLINELKMVAHVMDIDIYETIRAAATKPFGFTPYYPGPGLGGHCIPIDPYYLSWKANQLGVSTLFVDIAGEINNSMPNYVVQKTIEALNNVGKSVMNSKIFLLGLTYKKNVDDLRESPSLEILEKLIKLGAQVSFSDSYVKNIPLMRKHNFNLSSSAINKKNLNDADLLLLATDHDNFDYDLIEKESKLIVDTRGQFKKSEKIIEA